MAPAATLPQGGAWTEEMRALYHFTPQGSRLMPRRWFLALERADNETPFAAPENLARFGFIWSSGAAAARLNPDTLPIGFAVDPYSEPGNGQWLGLTCAACHSAEVTAHGRRFRVEGAPAALDFDSFGAELNAAVQATLRDAAKFGRLLQRVASAGGRTDGLRASFATYAAASDAHWRMQRPSLASGPGRVDALGQILNSLAATQLGEPANARPPSAPTSYPFLWTTPRQDYVQWAPIASSPIERNAGEVLGVFGHAELTARPWPRELGGGAPLRFASTVRFRDLFRMEQWLSQLGPPAWPAQLLGEIDRPLWERGRDLVAQHCLSCHTVPPNWRMTDPAQTIGGRQFIQPRAVPLSVVQTDAAYTTALTQRGIHTGSLADLFGGAPVVPAAQFFGAVVHQVTARGLDALNLTHDEVLEFGDWRYSPVPAGAPPGTLPQPWPSDLRRFGALKAGPLVGLWATGPFLHNGSVPTIDELLRRPEERRQVFWTGSRELDAERLGFVSDEAPGLFRFDTTLLGNGNGGHAFPATPLSSEERRAVLEYLKEPSRTFENVTLGR